MFRRLRRRVARDDPAPASRSDALVVFVHVPKTAGSTMNHYLARGVGSGHDHVEHWIEQPDAAAPRLRTAAYVSGHVRSDVFVRSCAAATDRPIRLVSLLREPFQQVRSHYNYLIEIFHRGEEFFMQHGEAARSISDSIRATDHTDPYRVIEQLDAASSLFLNNQTDFALGENRSWSTDEMLERLEAFEMIGTDANLPAFVGWLTGTTYDAERVNASRYHFDPAVFDDPVVRDFLAERNANDLALYELVQQRFALPGDADDVERHPATGPTT